MPQLIATPRGRFTADLAGPIDAPLVLLLHGFPQTRYSWRHQATALAAAGYRAVAFDQRGYSPGARPDPSAELSVYGITELVHDVLSVATAVTAGTAPMHLVGHDWGGLVAWVVAARHPDRLASLTVLSRPHPAAFRRAFEEDADGQRYRSRHHQAFQDPAVVSRLLADDASLLRKALVDGRVPRDAIDEYLALLGQPAALDAALAWYRAAGRLTSVDATVVQVPTLYLWGDADATVGATAARLTAEYVAAPFCFEVLRGAGHFLTDEVPDAVTAHLLAHIRRCSP